MVSNVHASALPFMWFYAEFFSGECQPATFDDVRPPTKSNEFLISNSDEFDVIQINWILTRMAKAMSVI